MRKTLSQTKKLSANVNEDLYNAVMREAEREKISVSALLTRLIKENIDIEEKEFLPIYNEEIPSTTETQIRLDSETSAVLHSKALEQGITDTAYVRNLIHTRDFKIYRIQTDDIEDFISEVHRAITALSSTVSIILKQGKGEIFEQDIKSIKTSADEIKTVLNKIVRNLYDTRKSVQNNLTKKMSNQ